MAKQTDELLKEILTPVTFAPGFSSSAETITLQVAV